MAREDCLISDYEFPDVLKRLNTAKKELRDDDAVHVPYTLATVIELLLHQQEKITQLEAQLAKKP